MASAPLTDSEKYRCLLYLGYSIFEDDGPAVRAFNSLPSHPLAPDFIRPILDELQSIEKEISDSKPLAKAISDGDIQLRAKYTISTLRGLGREQIQRLAAIVKVSIASDYFGAGGAARNPSTFYSGDPSERRIDASLGVPTISSGE